MLTYEEHPFFVPIFSISNTRIHDKKRLKVRMDLSSFLIFSAMQNNFSFLILILLFVTSSLCRGEKLSFNRDIRPILSDKCIGCHGPDAKHREAGLRLDLAEAAYAPLTESQGHAIVPGKPEESHIILRIDSKDPDSIMPPPKAHKTISLAERDILVRWIREGAEYQPHWSYTPIRRPAVPSVKGKINNPIDAFILANLEKKNISPSPQATSTDLLRRLSLDLTGLPPSPADVAAFSNQKTEYQNWVEKLLQSPQYGERMAVPWLDVVRFADTVGFHGDQNMRNFAYRDYVINSFNSDKPFDVFVKEQLAGDLLPNASEEQRIASALNRLNLMTREGGAQPKEYLAKYAADRVRAVGTAFLGQTTGCAECHDHKYDPITAKDFYSLGAFFADVKQWGVYSDYSYSPEPELAKFTNDYPFPPEIITQSSSLLARIARIEADVLALLEKHPVDPAVHVAWTAQMKTYLNANPDGWQVMAIAEAVSSKKTPVIVNSDGSATATGAVVKDDAITFTVNAPTSTLGSLRLEAMPDDRNNGFVGRSPGGHFSITPIVEMVTGSGQVSPIKISYAQADLSRPAGYSNGAEKTIDFKAAWNSAPEKLEIPADLTKRKQTAVLCFEKPLTLAEGAKLRIRVNSPDIGRIRISSSPVLNPVPGRPALSDALIQSMDSHHAAYHLCHTPVAQLPPAYLALLNEIRSCRAGWTRTLTTVAVPKEKKLTSRILPRGNWQDESGEIVKPGVLGFLPKASFPKDREATRIDLANWITAAENPLPARHYVNRLWKQFFGKGLSNVLDDLGGQGEAPSHPELLDWLASEFRESGWSTKHIVRLIVTSKTYQQAAAIRKDLQEIDPSNRLLAQQSARRLDAEFIRDHALSIAGILDTSYTGGPSSKPYQPAGYYTAIQFPDRDWVIDTGHSRMRRGLYTHWQRTFLHPMLANFDAPSREECSGDRIQANTPQQALTLLNDPVFQEASSALAQRVSKAGSIQASITEAFTLALSRSPNDEEMKSLVNFYQKQLASFQSGENQAKNRSNELAALGQTCRVILNLHETITRY